MVDPIGSAVKTGLGLTSQATEKAPFHAVNVCWTRYWSDTFIKTCHLAIFCGPPTAFQHGIVKGNSFHFPANVKFACEPRFCLQGPTESQCTENGKWSSVTPNCSRMFCPNVILTASIFYDLFFSCSMCWPISPSAWSFENRLFHEDCGVGGNVHLQPRLWTECRSWQERIQQNLQAESENNWMCWSMDWGHPWMHW